MGEEPSRADARARRASESGSGEYVKAELVGIYNVVTRAGGRVVSNPAMLLKGEDWGSQVLFIYIGKAEADAITRGLYGVATPRPMTHDLIISMLGALGARVERVTIDVLIEDVYTATVVLVQEIDGKVRHFHIDARPSDSVAIAVRAGASIYVHRRLREYAQDEEEVLPVERDA